MGRPRFLSLLSALSSLSVMGSAAVAATGDPPPLPSADPAYTAEQKAHLAALDREIIRFDTLARRVRDRAERASVKSFLDQFKDRQVALHAAFDHDTYLELRWEIAVEYQRLVAWLAGAAPAGPPRSS